MYTHKTTLVFNYKVANYLLMKEHKLVRIRPNFTEGNKLVFVFEGQLQDDVKEAFDYLESIEVK